MGFKPCEFHFLTSFCILGEICYHDTAFSSFERVFVAYLSRILPLLFLMPLLPGCGESQKQEKKSGLVVVNVLDEELYNDCHIQGSVNIPFEKVDELADTIFSNMLFSAPPPLASPAGTIQPCQLHIRIHY